MQEIILWWIMVVDQQEITVSVLACLTDVVDYDHSLIT